MKLLKKIKRKINNLKLRAKQNKLFKAAKLNKSKNFIVFIVPQEIFISGGILSIFNIAKTSRLFPEIHHSDVILTTFPSSSTYLKNNLFRNNEQIFNFLQIIDIAPQLENLIIHIPEYLTPNFYKKLSKSAIKKLKSVKNLQINILNQNIEIMPDKEAFKDLFKLTDNITQTTAHHKYSTEEVFNKYGLPLYLIPACIDLSPYAPSDYKEKENLIAYSPDNNPHREAVLAMLKEKLPDYKTIEIRNMSFDEYMNTITRAKYTISFGEGFDSYLIQPHYVGSIGSSVYNAHFFPDKNALSLPNIFKSYDELIEKFPELVRFHEQNQTDYNEIVEALKRYCSSLYNDQDYQNRIKKFYMKEYDFKL